MGSNIIACLDSKQNGACRELFENIQKYGKDVDVTLEFACEKKNPVRGSVDASQLVDTTGMWTDTHFLDMPCSMS